MPEMALSFFHLVFAFYPWHQFLAINYNKLSKNTGVINFHFGFSSLFMLKMAISRYSRQNFGITPTVINITVLLLVNFMVMVSILTLQSAKPSKRFIMWKVESKLVKF